MTIIIIIYNYNDITDGSKLIITTVKIYYQTHHVGVLKWSQQYGVQYSIWWYVTLEERYVLIVEAAVADLGRLRSFGPDAGDLYTTRPAADARPAELFFARIPT